MATLYTPLVDGQPGRAETFNVVFQEFEEAILERDGAFTARAATTTLTADAPTITIDLATQEYPTLMLVASLRSKSASVDSLRMRLNGDPSSTYATNIVAIDGSDTYSAPTNVGSFDFSTIIQSDSVGAGQYSFVTVTISQCHLATSKMIEFQAGRDATPKLWWGVGYWPGSAAVSQIQLSLSSAANFATGSTYALYGML